MNKLLLYILQASTILLLLVFAAMVSFTFFFGLSKDITLLKRLYIGYYRGEVGYWIIFAILVFQYFAIKFLKNRIKQKNNSTHTLQV
jgi:hypothetical protein